MSSEQFQSTLSPERLEFLLDTYCISPEVIEEKRRFLGKAWYALDGRTPIDLSHSRQEIFSGAIDQSREGTIGEVNSLMWPLMRTLRVHVSESDLNIMQSTQPKLWHGNHNRYFDISYLAQTLRETIGTDATTHFVMKKGIPGESFLFSAGGIFLLRGKDLKRQRQKNKERKAQGLLPQDIAEEYPELLRLDEVPSFLNEFTKDAQRNVAIFPQGTRQKKWKGGDAFHFSDNKVIPNMQKNIDGTPHCAHVVIAFDYRGWKHVDAHIRVLSEDEMRDGRLYNTVNGFLDGVKERK